MEACSRTVRPCILMQPNGLLVRLKWYTGVWVLRFKCMDMWALSLRQRSIRRALALLGCVALLYFAAGGTLLHHHTSGPETTCHICQALHAPALAATTVRLIPEAQQVAWHASLPESPAPSDPFGLYRASRAPPQS